MTCHQILFALFVIQVRFFFLMVNPYWTNDPFLHLLKTLENFMKHCYFENNDSKKFVRAPHIIKISSISGKILIGISFFNMQKSFIHLIACSTYIQTFAIFEVALTSFFDICTF